MLIKWISKMNNLMVDNIYTSRICLIAVMSICGLGLTYITNNDFKLILTGIAVLGMTQGIGTVFISILEAKTHKKSFVVVLDLLMIVVIFTGLYCSIYSWDRSAFSIDNYKIIYLDLLYYSFVTLTTTGYGDIVPVSYIAKFTSAAESFIFACIISVVIINFSKNLNDKR